VGPDRTDRRVRRTQQAVRGAFQSLIAEKGYDAVTVQDILERADVGRSTFYAHYRDKEDLLLSGFDDIRSALASAPAPLASGASGPHPEFLLPARSVFEHVGRYRHTWKPLVRKGGADVVTRILRDNAENLLREHLRQHVDGSADDEPLEATTQFLAGGLMGVLMWWLDSEAPCSADEVYAIFRRLAMQGTRRSAT
jgi:AcrR family transcriptional regulator